MCMCMFVHEASRLCVANLNIILLLAVKGTDTRLQYSNQEYYCVCIITYYCYRNVVMLVYGTM